MKTMLTSLLFWIILISQAQIQTAPQIVNDDDQIPDNFSGIISEKFADGRPKLWREVVNGKAEGLWLEWYPNGRLRYRAQWANGLGNGKWEYYYSNGQLKSESFYIDDIAQGLYFSYHNNGQLAKKSVYKNGQLDGLVYSYAPNGVQTNRQMYQDGKRVIDQPELFQPGLISTPDANEWDISFSPDGQTLYFTRRPADSQEQKIHICTRDSLGNWSSPKVAVFSTDTDEGVFVSPDGQRLFFASYRSLGSANAQQSMDMNIWVMDRLDNGWSSPTPLSPKISKPMSLKDEWPKNYESGPSIDLQGNLYFWTKGSQNNGTNIYQCQIQKNGKVSDPIELIPPSHHAGYDSWPVISPDGKLLFFASSNRSDGFGSEDIYYSRKVEGEWSKPQNLGPNINGSSDESMPRFSPDGKYFYFSSNREEGLDEAGEQLWSIYYMETRFLNLR